MVIYSCPFLQKPSTIQLPPHKEEPKKNGPLMDKLSLFPIIFLKQTISTYSHFAESKYFKNYKIGYDKIINLNL